ncbi:GntR family transcriptional regulator [Cerasicoccus maritimus]|uniref:GntR family transcriptional regulator n=1 Tax=Cerasicoccus maritimus TaxID=490089 RepID=UPI002852BC00|nr:GntR family transcriptional regulator [Cerasicoccus maritimus]
MIETRNVYIQLIELCQQQLAEGKWEVGARFPSERELAAEYGLSRATANKVLSKLVSEGWLEIRRGAGCFVAERPTLFSELRQMDSFTDFARANGLMPSTEVTAFESLREVNDHIAAKLQLKSRERVISIVRRRLLNGVPVIHEERWLPSKRYPRLKAKDLEGSFYAICRERYSLHATREDATLSAAIPPRASDMSGPTLCLDGAAYDAEDNPLWLQRLHYHGECFEMRHTSENLSAFPRMSLRLRKEFLGKLA